MSREFPLLVADVFEAAGRLRRDGETIAAAEGQTQSRWQVLSVLSGRPMTAPQAARRLGISRQAVQRVVNELVNDALVSSEPNPDHRTSPLLATTDAGRQVLQHIMDREAEAHRSLDEVITPEEVTMAREVLQRLNRHLRQNSD
ncbi:MarR family winged helix-turn-helix transcriptional regulator [Streptomyces cinereoruber]|uniref:MarR family winged helix-turn-helix transcriptional regulator n=1 Tax=Streptomyces cinereoruber TaxID=67260 RepID=UPI00364CB2CA